MKILAIDDQQLILISVKKRLSALGYEVETANSVEDGIMLYNTFKPDLVVLDMNMPEMSGNDLVECTGTEVVKYIRTFMNRETPILVMSGNTNESVILKNFDLGISDYLKKPVSLDELAARIKHIIGAPISNELEVGKKPVKQIIKKTAAGLVIYCNNDEKALLSPEFRTFANRNLGYHLCFVNDRSTDATLSELRQLRDVNPNSISVLNCEKKLGKAEAVRRGVQHLVASQQFEYIGFLDANLSTNLIEFDDLVDTIENSQFKMVSGSRIVRMGTRNENESRSGFTNKLINFMIRKTLKMPFADTKGGMKIMERQIASKIFKEKFATQWLFDVEIFMRMRGLYGKTEAAKVICEQPLKKWIYPDGSTLSIKNTIKIFRQLGQISLRYRLN